MKLPKNFLFFNYKIEEKNDLVEKKAKIYL